jgi:predicted ATPase/DNA-binding CsgD family transcriptional regulator
MTSTNLPVQLTSFIGRERDLAAVEQFLSTARLVTLTGAGGSGKTRLAIQIANTVSKAYADGVWFVDLAPLSEPELVPQLVVDALGLHPAPDQPVLELLLDFMQPKQMLLILDNCEHLSAACARFAQQVLSHAPELRILATSREPLGIAGERIYPLPGLGWPAINPEATRKGQGRLDLQELIGFDAIRLFVERARLFSPDFSLASENAPAVAEICQRLDGLPLALELASARLNVLTVREIAARLDDRFALLTSGQRTGLEARHHTLRAAIDWSYALLTSEEQALLRRLAVFAAGCSLDTAQAVCAGEGIEAGRTLDLLSSLVNKSLVIAETVGRSQARYRLLETIREYALDKLGQAGEEQRLRDRHLNLFLARVEEAAPRLGDAYQQLWLNWLEGEHDNLRAALAWSLEGGRIEAGLRISSALVRFLEIRGYVQEGMAWFERLLAQVDERVSPVVCANACTFAAFLAMFLGDAEASIGYGRKAVDFAEAAGDEGGAVLAIALAGLSSGARVAGDFQTAFTIGERVVSAYRESGPPFYLGMALIAQGDVAIELGYYDIARELLDESLTLAREAGDVFRIAHTLNALGDLARFQGNYVEAQSAYENSAVLLRQFDARHDLASILRNLGRTFLRVGDVERAHAMFSESLAIHQAEQHRVGMAECLIGFASIAVLIGMPVVGVRLLAAAAASGRQRTPYAWPTKRMEYEEYLELARSSLSVAEFQAAQTAGSTMSLEQAIDYALKLSLKPNAALGAVEEPGGLTRRELEVAALIERGLSNREIANELVLSRRTVEKHVANILSKLGFNSRAQIVRWAIEKGRMQASG